MPAIKCESDVKAKRRMQRQVAREKCITLKGHRLNIGQRLDAARGQELGKQTDRREQLHIGIVESELNEHRSCSTIDPV